MVQARFGTDGVRGVANAELTPELVLALGRATARILPAAAFIVGRDTRRSGPLLQAALAAGLAGEGADVIDVGVLPTPALAWMSAQRDLPAAVVSASHNPFADNGIKLFARGGTKLSTETEAAIEDALVAILDPNVRGPRNPEGHGVGRLIIEADAKTAYVEHLVSSLDGRRLDGMKLVVDCANGAASAMGGEVFERVGADVVVIGSDPDGSNINAGCGSTHTETLAAAVLEHRADLGLALDGDADRLLAVDDTGTLIGGDELLALFAVDLADRGQLAGNTVVVTVMTNLGFRLAMAERGIVVKETPVGDRYVLAALDVDGLALGGEQSGHIVFRQMATTGDGLLTGLVLADLVTRMGKPLSDLVRGLVTRVPQVLVNVPVPNTELLADAEAVWSAVAEEQDRLSDTGRVLLRPSGTEPVVRVMVEAAGDGLAEEIAQRLSALVAYELQAAAATPG
jgi:phosphoglucosamine mutase